jgi:hypothetical protein
MKFRKLASPLFAFCLITGCIHHETSGSDMIAEINGFRSGKDAAINIIWYKGSNADFDYFGFVYAMFRGKNYKVPTGQFVLPRMPLTGDSSKWLRISEIEGMWVASRKNGAGVWAAENEGISVRLKH